MYASVDNSGPQVATAPQEGFMAPDFTLETFDGRTVSLSDFKGQVVMLNIWASWCPPCKAEMPSMESAYQKYQDQGFVVLAVNATHQDSATDAAAFINQSGFTFPVLLDSKGVASNLYQLRSLPTSFFIDKEGVIREIIFGGPIPEAGIQARVESLLAEMP